jgi:hypothetical protein
VLKLFLCYNLVMQEENTNIPERVFALITDVEVFHKWYVEENYEDSGLAPLIYGLQSNPNVVDITEKNHEEIQ